MSSLVYTQDFESLALGMLTDQDGWHSPDPAQYIVETAITHSGIQAVSVGSVEQSFIGRNIMSLDIGVLGVAVWPTSTSDTHFEIYIDNGTEQGFSGRGILEFRPNGMIAIATPAGVVVNPLEAPVVDLWPYLADTWYRCHLEFDVPTNLYRVSVDEIVGGAWSAWYPMLNSGAISHIHLGHNYGNSVVTYFDDVVIHGAVAQ